MSEKSCIMTQPTVQFTNGNPGTLTVYTHPTPKGIRIFLGLFASIAFIAPVLVTIILLVTGSGLSFGLIISYIIFWAVGYYLLRIILWNTFGKEIITFENDKITYHCDYKYFQDNKKEIKTDQLRIEIIKSEHHTELGLFCFTNSDEKIEMVIPVSIAQLVPVEEEIRKNYISIT